MLSDNCHSLNAQGAGIAIESREQTFHASKGLWIMDEKSLGALIESNGGHSMTNAIGVPTDHECDLVMNQTGCNFRCNGKEAHVKSSFAQPIGGGPFVGSPKCDLGGNFLGQNVNPTSRKCCSDTGGNASLVCLDRSMKRQTYPLAAGVLL